MPRKKVAATVPADVPTEPPPYRLPEGHVLLLRSCNADMTSKNGFVWPKSGPVICPDWVPVAKCGNGLHGLLPHQKDPGVWYDDGVAMAVQVRESDLILIEDGAKCKFPEGVVVCVGDMAEVSEFFAKHSTAEGLYRRVAQGGDGSTLTGGNRSTLTGGDDSTLTGGNDSTLTGGNDSTLTGGYDSTLTGGYRSTLTGGDRSTLTGGYRSTLTGGYRSTLTGGYRSTLTGGDRSTLTGGNDSTLTGGDRSTLTGGNDSTLTGGNDSTLTGGDRSTLVARWWDSVNDRPRMRVHYVGEDGILADTPYRCEKGELVCLVQPSDPTPTAAV